MIVRNCCRTLLALLLGLTSISPAEAFENPALFRASEILAPALLSGPSHRVREYAEADGYLIHFTIDSDFGTYACAGVSELQRRIEEIEAIAELVKVSKSDLFAEGLRKSVETPIAAVKNIAADPGGAIKQVPHSVGHFFGKVGSGIGNAARKAGDKKSGESPQPETVGRGLGKAIKNVAGFDKAKLECARQLGIDPYTDNARLQEEMEKVAWAFFAGGLPLKIGFSIAGGGASEILNATEFVGLPDDLYQLNSSELDFLDRTTLKSMGVSPEQTDALFANPSLIRSVRHQLVNTLAALPAKGRAEIIEQILACDTVWRAHFFHQTMLLLLARHRDTPYQELAVHDRLATGITTDGAIEIPAPVDYVVWTESVAAFATRDDIARFQRRLLLQGNLSSETQSQLAAAGWEIVRVKG
jgi:hypothetical protein